MKREIKYFDVHSHLHSNFFNKKENGQKVAEKMMKKNFFSILVGVNLEDSIKAVEMTRQNKNLFSSIGIHPTEKINFNQEKFQDLVDKNKEKIVAVGECGFDYYWLANDFKKGKINEADFIFEKKRQKKLFQDQIDFALKNNLPLILHIRSHKNSDAHWDTFKILDQKEKESGKKIRADFHFFTEGPEIVDEIIKRNFMISLPGVITFANLNKSIEKIPLKNLMVETDSPFAAPVPHRGKINTPLFLPEIIKKIVEVKNKDFEEIRKKITNNSLKFFKIKY